MRLVRTRLLALAIVALILSAAAPGPDTYLPVVLRLPTYSLTATPTRTATATRTVTRQASVTHTATQQASVTHTATQQAAATQTATRTPTQSQTGAATQIPTQTPTPTRTPIPSELTILPNHSTYATAHDGLYIMGEVRNNTGAHMRSVRISANLFDAGGTLLATAYGYAKLDPLPPDATTCFDILFPSPPAGWSYYEFEAPSFSIGGYPLPALTVLNESGSYDSSLERYTIIGQIRNDAGVRVENVRAIGTLYNAGGAVIGCNTGNVISTHLNPDQVSAFDIPYTGERYAAVASYRLQADGTPR